MDSMGINDDKNIWDNSKNTKNYSKMNLRDQILISSGTYPEQTAAKISNRTKNKKLHNRGCPVPECRTKSRNDRGIEL